MVSSSTGSPCQVLNDGGKMILTGMESLKVCI